MISLNKIVAIAAFLFFTGCDNDYSITAEKSKPVSSRNASNLQDRQNLISFKVNGELVSTTGWTISRFVTNSNLARVFLNITSNMHEDKRTINVNLTASVPGNYPVTAFTSLNGSTSQSYGSYYPDYAGDQLNSYSFTSGAFNLTEVDTTHQRVNGNFYGKVKNSKGDSLEITDGKIINGFLKVDITSY